MLYIHLMQKKQYMRNRETKQKQKIYRNIDIENFKNDRHKSNCQQ